MAQDLPGNDPVAWRACRGRSLASSRALVRLGLPAAVLALAAIHPVAQVAALAAATLLLTAVGAGLVAAEREGETIEVLLVSGISPRDLVAHKARALRRIHLAALAVLAVPLLLHTYLSNGGASLPRLTEEHASALIALPGLLLVPALGAWIGVAAGLAVRRRGRAIATATLVLVVWGLGMPFLTMMLCQLFAIRGSLDEIAITLSSPFGMPMVNATGTLGRLRWEDHWPWVLAVWIVLHLGVLVVLRRCCLIWADRLLRRA